MFICKHFSTGFTSVCDVTFNWSFKAGVSGGFERRKIQLKRGSGQKMSGGFCCSVLLFGFVVRFCCSVLLFGFVVRFCCSVLFFRFCCSVLLFGFVVRFCCSVLLFGSVVRFCCSLMFSGFSFALLHIVHPLKTRLIKAAGCVLFEDLVWKEK